MYIYIYIYTSSHVQEIHEIRNQNLKPIDFLYRICIYIIYKYITYLDLETMIVQNNIKQIYTIELAAAAAAKAAAANPIVCRGLILCCTH